MDKLRKEVKFETRQTGITNPRLIIGYTSLKALHCKEGHILSYGDWASW